MINFVFNLASEQARIELYPQNTFTEIDTIANLFGIQRYPGERYKDFYDFFNKVSNQTRDGSMPDLAQIASRSDLFFIKMMSKSTDYRFKIEITGNHDLIITQNSWESSSWTSTQTSWDLTNRKLHPYLHDLVLDVRTTFPELEIEVHGIESEGDFGVCGMNIHPARNFSRSGDSPADTQVRFTSSAMPNTLVYATSTYILKTSTNLSTAGFYIDHHIGRLYCSTQYVNNLNISYDIVENPFILTASKGVRTRTLCSTEAFIKMVQNETLTPNRYINLVTSSSTQTSTEITGLHETPYYCRFFEEDIELRYRVR